MREGGAVSTEVPLATLTPTPPLKEEVSRKTCTQADNRTAAASATNGFGIPMKYPCA